VIGNAISRGNPGSRRCRAEDPVHSLPEAVRDHFLWGSRSIVIASTHGKTTTTSLTGWLLTCRISTPVLVGACASSNQG
jgi:UDP-N-acetylmuramate: L-alanyl-gamma-D-glutamyl-meso-diaminopimelate ligase